MPSLRRSASVGSRYSILVIAAALLAVSAANPMHAVARVAPVALPRVTAAAWPAPVVRAVPAALTADGLDLHAPPVPVPLELKLPTLGVEAAVLGVGITPGGAMDAPEGKAGDPVWDQAFWYRGSAIPGATSTAVIAGHIDGPSGRFAAFGHLDSLRPGDPIVVHDTRTGLDVRFSVVSSASYTLEQAANPAVLAKIYGVGPANGTAPQPSVDGLAHLTLITCAGTFRNGTHDHRLVVDATRVG